MGELLCRVCGGAFDPAGTRRVTCGAECAAKRHAGQLTERSTRRTAARQAARAGRGAKCSVCGAAFVPRNSQQRYCGNPECSVEGIRRAVERQTARREAARAARAARGGAA